MDPLLLTALILVGMIAYIVGISITYHILYNKCNWSDDVAEPASAIWPVTCLFSSFYWTFMLLNWFFKLLIKPVKVRKARISRRGEFPTEVK